MNNLSATIYDHLDNLLGEVADDYLQQLALGKQPEIEQYADEHPEIAQFIRQTFPALKVVSHSLTEINSGAGLDLSRSKQLGDFRLLRELGSGGMGFVYEAEQMSMGRRVALKILPMVGALQQKQLQRFRNEVRAAAMLDHPHVVSVYSVGEDRGVHYYAMQLIRGQSLAEVITELRQLRRGNGALTGESIHRVLSSADAQSPSPSSSAQAPTEAYSSQTDESVDAASDTRPSVKAQITTDPEFSNDHGFFRSAALLGIQAAEALQHAHDLGVLHRDIKPGNLMLDAEAQLHVTDFGLARIESDAGMTMTGDVVGTLRYMPPEQALATSTMVDNRADVYALGVTLYELLTLQPAFDGRSREALLRQIAVEEPKPLTRINRAIPRDLETIVLKAISKDPNDRYLTSQALADDLRRYLADEPIRARPPTLGQRVARWSRRHRPLVTSVAVSAALLLIISFVVLLLSNIAITHQRKVAEQKTATTEAVIQFINDDLLSAADPLKQPDRDIKLRTVVDRAASQIDERFGGQPLVRASLRMTLGKTYQSLGEYAHAKPQYEAALQTLQRIVGNEHQDALECQLLLASLHLDLGNDAEAERLIQFVFMQQLEQLGDAHPKTLRTMSELADLCHSTGLFTLARRLSHHVLTTRSDRLTPQDPLVISAKQDYALVIRDLGELSAAERLLTEVVQARQLMLGPQHPETLAARLELVTTQWESNNNPIDTQEFERLLNLLIESLGPDHPRSLIGMHRVALARIEQNRFDEAAEMLTHVRTAAIKSMGESHPFLLQIDLARGRCQAAMRSYIDAREQLEDVLDRSRATHGEWHAFTFAVKSELAVVYDGLGWTGEAESLRKQSEYDRRTSEDSWEYRLTGGRSLAFRGKTQKQRQQELDGRMIRGLLNGRDVRLQRSVRQVAGIIGQAFLFDGDASYALAYHSDGVAYAVDFPYQGSLSILCWVRVDSLPNSKQSAGTIVARTGERDGRCAYRLRCLSGGELEFGIVDSTEEASVSASLTPGRTTHVAATLDDSTGVMRLYLDGNEVASRVTSVRPAAELDRARLMIGNEVLLGNEVGKVPFHGLIDELEILGRAIPQEEILRVRDRALVASRSK